jgi:hypothetical protein
LQKLLERGVGGTQRRRQRQDHNQGCGNSNHNANVALVDSRRHISGPCALPLHCSKILRQ